MGTNRITFEYPISFVSSVFGLIPYDIIGTDSQTTTDYQSLLWADKQSTLTTGCIIGSVPLLRIGYVAIGR